MAQGAAVVTPSMPNHSTTLIAATVATVFSGPAAAQQAPVKPSVQAVQAAADATRAARKITFETRNGSGVSGTVGLYTIGRSRTRVLVTLPAGQKYRVLLYPGTDCVDNRSATAAAVALAPTNFSKTGASSAATIVSLPIERVRSNYVVDVRDANNRTALTEACARLNR